MSTPRPNLFLIGSMKSGTTYLSELLGTHPAVFMSLPKEPTYFVDQQALRRGWPWMWEQGYWRSEERYLGLFAAAGGAAIIGEASTSYTKLPMFTGVVERILDFNAQARFVYVMRDPVERTISHYWHSVNRSSERRPMLGAIQSDPEYTDVGYYAWQLHEYLQRIDRKQIYVLTFEELLADPAGQMSRLFAWLGVDPSFRPSGVGATHVTPAVVDRVRGLGVLNGMRRSSWYRKLEPYVPSAVRKIGSQLAAESVRPEEIDTFEVEAYLRSVLLPQTAELERLLNRTFPEWTTLYAQPAGDGETGAVDRDPPG